MSSDIGLGNLVSVLYEQPGMWYPSFVITEGRGSHGTFYHIVWDELPLHEHNTNAIVNSDDVGHCITSISRVN
eukprot:6408122-Ditylum_brightwellii.AAC.1